MTVKTIEPIATPIRVRYEETDLGVSNAVMLLLSRTNVGAVVVGSGVVDASIGCVEDADDVHVVDHVDEVTDDDVVFNGTTVDVSAERDVE